MEHRKAGGDPLSSFKKRASNPDRPEARESNRVRLTHSLDEDLPAKSSQLSLSQKPDTPQVVDFWMSALAGITLFSAVFPTLALHRTLESVYPA